MPPSVARSRPPSRRHRDLLNAAERAQRAEAELRDAERKLDVVSAAAVGDDEVAPGLAFLVAAGGDDVTSRLADMARSEWTREPALKRSGR